MSIDEANDKLVHLRDLIQIKIDLMCQQPDRWVGFFHNGKYFWNAKYQQPTFEYYYKNCVLDKGGEYDFTASTTWMGHNYGR